MKYINIVSINKPELEANCILMFRGCDFNMDSQRYENIFELIGAPVENTRTPIVFIPKVIEK